MSTAMSIYVMALVLINVIGCLWLLSLTTKKRPNDPAADSTTHLWDGDLEELNNPLPKWWLNLFYITIVFAVIYLILYPGFGNHQKASANPATMQPAMMPAHMVAW